MKTKAVRLYGKDDLRIESFELPAIGAGEILARVICDSLCMSSYKAVRQGPEHKRVPDNVAEKPVIIGHEFAGEILEVGDRWKTRFKAGDKFAIQPALNYENGPVGILSAPGYSYPYLGGDASYVVIPEEVMEQSCLLVYKGPGYFPASMAEPFSCVIGAMHANYHTRPGSYVHEMEIVDGGRLALLAGVGPMGLAAINYVLSRPDRKPSLMVVTDIDQDRLDRAAGLYSPAMASERGIELCYLNTAELDDPLEALKEISGAEGYNDVFVFAPVAPLIEQADALLAFDGCLNFFAGPSDPAFCARLNFYKVHYAFTHVVGTSGGNTDDIRESLALMEKGMDPAGLITHIGGLNAVPEATLSLPDMPGGKKLIYTNLEMPLLAISDFAKLGEKNPLFARLAKICERHNGLWSVEAEELLLSYGEHPVVN
ncbi:MAG: L-sorbose 1-phosphate reductase [Bacteroidetes bacterium]|nr:MAG: L-sorbose 1-phosphate reductase [Bacteroidota bacterium]